MSDGLPPGAVNLEDGEGPTPVRAVTETPPPADPTVAPPNEADEDPAGTITGSGGVKFVPLEAAQSARQAAKEAKAALAQKDQEVAALKDKADRYDKAEQHLRTVQPYLDKMMQRPDVLKMLDQPPAPPSEPAGPLSQQAAVEYAKDFDLYTPDGKPDVDRAQRIAKRNQDMIMPQIQQAIQPIAQHTHLTQAQQIRQRIAASPGAPSAASLDKVTNFIPAELMSQPGVGELAFLVAKGLDAVSTPVKTVPPPVVPTESLGGPPKSEPSITDLDKRVMEYAGISKKQFEEAAARFKPGQNNILE